jgi:hypothetical protein
VSPGSTTSPVTSENTLEPSLSGQHVTDQLLGVPEASQIRSPLPSGSTSSCSPPTNSIVIFPLALTIVVDISSEIRAANREPEFTDVPSGPNGLSLYPPDLPANPLSSSKVFSVNTSSSIFDRKLSKATFVATPPDSVTG